MKPEILTEPIVRINGLVNKEINDNIDIYSFSIDYASTRDVLNQTNTSDMVDIIIEVDTSKPLDTEYKDLIYSDVFGDESSVFYKDKDNYTYKLKYKLVQNDKALDIVFAGEFDNELSNTITLRLDDNFKIEDTKPEEPSDCNCNGTYKILIETISASVNKPATYQYLSVNNEAFEASLLEDGVDKYCEELDNYKRKQLTLIKVESVELLPKIEGDTVCTCPHCGQEIDIDSLK